MAISHGDNHPQLRHILEVVYIQIPLGNFPAPTQEAQSALSAHTYSHSSALSGPASSTTHCSFI